MNHAAQLQTAEKALSSDLSAAFSSALAERFGARFSVAQAVRAHHGRDESSYDPMLPDAVVFARSTEEVAAADASLGGMAAPRAFPAPTRCATTPCAASSMRWTHKTS